jgi:hypothetical protein
MLSGSLSAGLTPSAAVQAPEPAAQVAVKEGPAYVAPTAPIHVVTAQEAEVYAAFLAQAWGQGKSDGPLARQTLLLENDALDSWQPGRRAWEKYLLNRVSGQGRAAEDLHLAFLKRPQEVIRFYGFPAVPMPVRLIRSDVLKASFGKKGWDGFYDSYPNTQGVLSLSRACFNDGGSEALFSARLRCGKTCGYRDIVFMRKVNGEWTLIMKDSLP